MAYFRQLAVNYRTGYYDERNETAARRAAMMYDTLMNGDEIYDPEKPYKTLKDSKILVKICELKKLLHLCLHSKDGVIYGDY